MSLHYKNWSGGPLQLSVTASGEAAELPCGPSCLQRPQTASELHQLRADAPDPSERLQSRFQSAVNGEGANRGRGQRCDTTADKLGPCSRFGVYRHFMSLARAEDRLLTSGVRLSRGRVLTMFPPEGPNRRLEVFFHKVHSIHGLGSPGFVTSPNFIVHRTMLFFIINDHGGSRTIFGGRMFDHFFALNKLRRLITRRKFYFGRISYKNHE